MTTNPFIPAARPLRALTLTQPWATLVAIGAKSIETRSWATSFRGPIAVHAAQGLGPVGGRRGLWELCRQPAFSWALHPHFATPDALPRGAIVAVAELADCRSTREAEPGKRGWKISRNGKWRMWDLTDQERAFGDYSPGRYAWLLSDVRRLATPIPYRGALGLWQVPAEVQTRVMEGVMTIHPSRPEGAPL